jgi:hypothetical protein
MEAQSSSPAMLKAARPASAARKPYHDPTGDEEDEEVHHFAEKKRCSVVHTVQKPVNLEIAGVDQCDDDRQENAQPPPGLEFRWVVEHTRRKAAG